MVYLYISWNFYILSLRVSRCQKGRLKHLIGSALFKIEWKNMVRWSNMAVRMTCLITNVISSACQIIPLIREAVFTSHCPIRISWWPSTWENIDTCLHCAVGALQCYLEYMTWTYFCLGGIHLYHLILATIKAWLLRRHVLVLFS